MRAEGSEFWVEANPPPPCRAMRDLAPEVWGLRFGVSGFGFRVSGMGRGVGVWEFRFGGESSGFRFPGSGFRAQGEWHRDWED